MVFACIPKRQNTGYIEIYREDIQFKLFNGSLTALWGLIGSTHI
jgi:hypothetical protein